MAAIPTNKATGQSLCVVTAKDYARYFEGKGAIDPPVWVGEERRIGLTDRRANAHDRRWERARGRRYRIAGRRIGDRSV